MTRLYVDPPSGWRYGFPKVWDEDRDGPLTQWLEAQGYPVESYPNVIRFWEAGDDEE